MVHHEYPFNCSNCDSLCCNKAMFDMVHYKESHLYNICFGQKVRLDVHISGVHLKESYFKVPM